MLVDVVVEVEVVLLVEVAVDVEALVEVEIMTEVNADFEGSCLASASFFSEYAMPGRALRSLLDAESPQPITSSTVASARILPFV